MSVERVTRRGSYGYRVRWREPGRINPRSRTFDSRRDAELFDGDLRRRRRLGALAQLDAGSESLDEYVAGTWGPARLFLYSEQTRRDYARWYDRDISPFLGHLPLRELTAGHVELLQAQLLRRDSLGHETVRKILNLLSGILTRAARDGRIVANPVRVIERAKAPLKDEVRPIEPSNVEAMRSALDLRGATVMSLLAYAGLRPGELRRLRWGHVQTQTLVVNSTKTRRRRSVRLLAPLAADLTTWRTHENGGTNPADPVIPDGRGGEWTPNGFNKWRARVFVPAAHAVGLEHVRPYDCRHTFASLLLHEGRSVIYVARQLGHGAELTLGTYGHVMQELDGAPSKPAEEVIREARLGRNVSETCRRLVAV